MPKLPVAEKDSDDSRDPKLNEDYVPAKEGPAAAFGAHAAGLDTAWAKHKQHFAWAWELASTMIKHRRSEFVQIFQVFPETFLYLLTQSLDGRGYASQPTSATP